MPRATSGPHTQSLLLMRRADLTVFRAESDERVRRIAPGVLFEAKLHEALPVFVEQLRSDDESLRFCVFV